jgi:hypothetical protein
MILHVKGARSKARKSNSPRSRSEANSDGSRSPLRSPVAARPSSPPPGRSYVSMPLPKDNRTDYCCAGPVGSCTCASDEDFSPRSVSCSARLRPNCRPAPWPGIQTW